jgi:hypothetical protein
MCADINFYYFVMVFTLLPWIVLNFDTKPNVHHIS